LESHPIITEHELAFNLMGRSLFEAFLELLEILKALRERAAT
jgi:hypothetical protein